MTETERSDRNPPQRYLNLTTRGIASTRLCYEGLSAQISWLCTVAGLLSLVVLLSWAPLAAWRGLSCAGSAGARRRRAVPGDATATGLSADWLA